MEPNLGDVPPYISILIWALLCFLVILFSIVAYFTKRYLENNDAAIQANGKAITGLNDATNKFSLAVETFGGEVNRIHTRLDEHNNILIKHEHNIKMIFKEFGREIKNHERQNETSS